MQTAAHRMLPSKPHRTGKRGHGDTVMVRHNNKFRRLVGLANGLAISALFAGSASASENLVIIPDARLFGLFDMGEGLGSMWVMLIGFLILVFPLNSLIFQPIFNALDARAERIQGARDRSAQLEREASNVLERYEDAIREARVDAEANRQAGLSAAREEQVTLTTQARSEAETELTRARTEMNQSLDDARATIRASAEDLATAAAEQVLGRTLS